MTSVKALDALFAKVAPALGATRRTSSRGRPHPRQGRHRQGAGVEGCLQAARHRADLGRRRSGRRGCPSSGTSGVQFAEVHGRHRNRHRQGEAHPRDAGLRAGRRQADGREPGPRRHHRGDQLRAVRGSHPRSRHRPDGEPEHGVVPAGRHVRHAADRRRPEQHAGARRHRHRRAADRVDRVGDRQRGAQRHRRDDSQPAAAPAQGARGDSSRRRQEGRL